MQRLRLAAGVLLLMGAALVLLLAARASLRPDEAWMAWAVHFNPTDVHGQIPSIDTAREVARHLRDDVQQAVERARPAGPLTLGTALLLNMWTLLAGDSELALRLPVVLLALLAAALAVRWLWARRAAAGGLALLLAGALAAPLLSPAVDWRAFLEQVAEQRRSTDVALVAWPPHSVIGYYERRLPLRTGISVDVGWRPFSAAEIRGLLTRFDDEDVIWLLLYNQPEIATVAQASLAQDRARSWTHRGALHGFVAWRYQR